MATKTVQDSSLTAVADAIRAKTGKSASMEFPTEFVSEIGSISGGGGNDDILITGQMGNNSYTFPQTSLGGCFALSKGAFSLTMPNLTTITAQYAVQRSEIVHFSAPNLLTSATYAFLACPSLATVDAQRLQQVASYMFQQCSALTKAFFPYSQINDASFENCTSLTTAVFGSINTQWKQCYGCTSLTAAEIGTATRLTNTFQNCSNLATVVLRQSTSVPPLYSMDVFANTPFKSGGAGGTIYIPKALYDHLGDGTSLDYKAATNWSTYEGYGTITWAQIEGSQYETHYADGTVIPT